MIDKKIINSSFPILLVGEPGVGKSYHARNIHAKSNRVNKKFICYHLGSSKDEFIQSDLFGHTKGAFSNAIKEKVGLCEEVKDGTLFIDEIGDLSQCMQKTLLEILEERCFRRLGSNLVKKFYGKFIFATNKNLQTEVLKGNFRKDLLDRISFISLTLPSLKNDKERISQFISNYQFENNVVLKLSKQIMTFFLNYTWPGNIRELKNILDFFMLISCGDVLCFKDLPNQYSENIFLSSSPLSDYKLLLSMKDKKLIEQFLSSNNGKINKTTKSMGISKNTLLSKIKKYKIRVEDFF